MLKHADPDSVSDIGLITGVIAFAAVKAMNVFRESVALLNLILSPVLAYWICLTLTGSVISQINGSLFGTSD